MKLTPTRTSFSPRLPLWIAWRYIKARGKKRYIHLVSLVSLIGILISTASLLFTMALFHGMDDFIHTMFRSFYPDVKISAPYGRLFTPSPKQLQSIRQLPGVDHVTEVLEDDVLLKYGDHEVLARLRGVSTQDFLQNCRLKDKITEGHLAFPHQKKHPPALIGRGIQYSLRMFWGPLMRPLQVCYPTKIDPGKQLKSCYRSLILHPQAVFAIEKTFDEGYLFAPLTAVNKLMHRGKKRSELAVQLKDNVDIHEVKLSIKKLVSPDFQIQDYIEQNEAFLKASNSETLLIYAVFLLIIAIATLNLFFILAMLTLEKRKDVAILRVMGASKYFVGGIFLGEGLLIASIGSCIGIAIATGLILLQQKFGWLKMGLINTLFDAYPLRIEGVDFFIVLSTVFLSTLFACFYPAKKASENKLTPHL